MTEPLGVTAVVKVGGSLSRDRRVLRRLAERLAIAEPRPIVTSGGGALADAVRRLHAGGELGEETAHRMALLALDAMGLWLVELAGGDGAARAVRSPAELADARAAGLLPVVTPSTWLEREGPLPASWSVTSDSIAAWLAARLGAARLLLLKPFAIGAAEITLADLGDAVDPHFPRALPPGVECVLVDGRDPDAVEAVLAGRPGGTRLQP